MTHPTQVKRPEAKRPTRAMMLAAGIGKRMRPLTATTPKPLIEVAGKALIDHGLDRLVDAGVETVVVNVHYLADLVEFHVLKRAEPKVLISDERSGLLETGGGIVKALDMIGPDPFFLFNSDSFWIDGYADNLELLVEFWDEATMDILLLLSPTVTASGYDGQGDFTMDPLGRLERRIEGRVAPFVYAGTAIIHPRIFAGTAQGRFSLNKFFDRALESGRLYGVHMDGIWLHVGTPEAIREAEETIRHSAA
ncbi:mannose-1-phosphate guanylyltransferase [Prosthecomicrobium hirschii]|uniref:Mannose-1-phosphate guanylyltransferase n=1 Tax=Prosthecodimorpha hirschii TaxID=665126 RepID=A0A0P6VMR4_9HYPH|nr:nucleotidyltransferase family protein [Prosthecomicrobium hirschii]KPL54046.1 mannose-1-phosphate guanylyltransferase [Prosthecomicrobium hirschii]TPQ50943.1 nucleotidyltransferase family protein [Prosthecomicrobium hirschii]